MATLSPVEVTNFVGGLVTDANPMSYPPNASLDEYNMVINQDGTRSRRLGMDLEVDYDVILVEDVARDINDNITYKTFKWSNVAGVPNLTFVVVQIGSYIAIHKADSNSLSAGGPIFTYSLSEVVGVCSFASVDGLLVVASGSKELLSIEYKVNTKTFVTTPYRLLIRDTFGVEDIYKEVNYREGSNIAKRPWKLTGAHSYNLRNQTWALPRLQGGLFQEKIQDCISAFLPAASGALPSNADSVLDALYPNTASVQDPNTNRFNAKELVSNPPGTLSAPRGYFIIDALDRGASRLSEVNKLYRDNPLLDRSSKPKNLPLDSTQSGATCIAQFAGRIFYGGFTSETVDGDSVSPHMGSYVLFSKLVENYTDLKVCYQVGDPTSKNYSELLDTDGGFFRLEGAYNIQAMIPLPNGLAVVAENGIWLLSGEDRGQFKATSYSTSKISPNGCDSPSSVVVTGDGFMFWSIDGIYEVAPNQFGDLQVSNITKGKIQNFYSSISQIDRKFVIGSIDKFERKAKWVYGNRLSSETLCRELVYSFDFQSFTPNRINRGTLIDGDYIAKPIVVVAPVVMPPFSSVSVDSQVFAGGDLVLVGSEEVIVSEYESIESLTETKYLCIVDSGDDWLTYSFASYSNTDHYDWSTLQGDEGIDAESAILTGWLGGGDFQRNKQVPFLMMHFFKSETGFAEVDPEDPLTDWVALNQSSCKVQVQWNWANHTNSGKWGTPFQAYRFSRFWQPPSLSSAYDNGFYTVETRNKLRGSGKVMSLLIKSDPGKHMDIIGWSMMLQGRAGV